MPGILKSLIKSQLRRLGYRLVPYSPYSGPSLRLLPLLVKLLALQNDSFYFVQIGANDGVMDDPLYKIVTEHRLAGLLVEPMPDFFENLLYNYSGQSQLKFENCAVATTVGTAKLYRFRAGTMKNPLAYGHASFFRSHLEKQENHFPGCASSIEELDVPTMPLSFLFEKHNIRKMDLLQIDTEGFDFEIIKMLLQTNIRPTIVSYERVNLGLADQEACREALRDVGYSFADDSGDTVAVHAQSF